jgi:Bifunctional DNA primase/polymerase, N-terminal
MTSSSFHTSVETAADWESSIVFHALEYARRGIPVFPCKRADKSPLTKNGFKDATCDEQQIREW